MQKLSIGIILFILFIFLGFISANNIAGISYMNNAAEVFFAHIRTAEGIRAMSLLTKMGESEFLTPVIGISLAAFLLLRRWKIATVFALGIWIVNFLITYTKNFFRIPRPSPMFYPAGGYSFPSGHTSSAGIVFLIIAAGWGSVIKNRFLRAAGYVLFAAVIVVVGISRMYLNVHWLTDVVGALLLVSSCTLVLFGITSLLEKNPS
jgi:undecaprenyl-diphosphatase